MGLAFSVQTNVTKQIIREYQETITNIVSSVTSSSTSKSDGTQTANVTNCGPQCESPGFQYPPVVPGTNPPAYYCVINGNVNVNQIINQNTSLNSSTLNDTVASVKASVQSKTEEFIENLNSTQPTWFTAAMSVTTNVSEFIKETAQKMTNSISVNTDSVCVGESNAIQSSTFLNCGVVNGNVNVNQSIYQTNTVSCVYKQIVKITIDDSLINEAIQRGNNATKTGGDSFWSYILYGVLFIIIIFVLIAMYKAFTRTDTPPVKPVVPPGKRVPVKPPVKGTAPPLPPRSVPKLALKA